MRENPLLGLTKGVDEPLFCFDHDVKFQEYCLNLMKNASDGDVLKKQIAYLTDRILVNTGKKQLYGTQFYLNKKGVYGPRPIKDLEI
jgi:hypothetical protein